MKLLKKLVGLVLVGFICFPSIPVLAQNNIDEIPVKNITSDVLDSKLKKVVESGTDPVTTTTLVNKDTGLTYNVDVYEVQLDNILEKNSNINNESVCYVASTDYMELDTSTLSPSTRGSIQDSQWDSSYSVKLLLGYNFDKDSRNYCKITDVWGNVMSNSGVSITQGTSQAEQFFPTSGISEYTPLYNVRSNFHYNTNFQKWAPVGPSGNFGAYWRVTIQRGSSWEFNFLLYQSRLGV